MGGKKPKIIHTYMTRHKDAILSLFKKKEETKDKNQWVDRYGAAQDDWDDVMRGRVKEPEND